MKFFVSIWVSFGPIQHDKLLILYIYPDSSMGCFFNLN